MPADQRELISSLDEQSVERQKGRVELMKRSLAEELARYENDVKTAKFRIEVARRGLEDCLVRSPLDGVVVQIYSRQRERIGSAGIAKIVGLSLTSSFRRIPPVVIMHPTSAALYRSRSWSQFVDQSQDLLEQFLRHRDLGHLEDGVASVAHDLSLEASTGRISW